MKRCTYHFHSGSKSKTHETVAIASKVRALRGHRFFVHGIGTTSLLTALPAERIIAGATCFSKDENATQIPPVLLILLDRKNPCFSSGCNCRHHNRVSPSSSVSITGNCTCLGYPSWARFPQLRRVSFNVSKSLAANQSRRIE